MRWWGCCLLIGQSHALMDFPFLNWCHISLTAAGGRAGGGRGGEKNKTRGGVCKVRPRTFIAWWVLPAGRGTSLLHRKSNATPGATPGCRTSVCGPAAECLRLNIAAAFPRVNDSHVCPQLRIEVLPKSTSSPFSVFTWQLGLGWFLSGQRDLSSERRRNKEQKRRSC